MFNNKEKNQGLKRNFGYIQLTRKCNRKCVFCSNPYVNDALSFDDAMKQIDDYIKKGINEITLSGGEPTLNNNIFKVIKYCKNKGINCRIITNGGKLADEEYVTKIANAGLRNIHISIYSHKKEIQDKLTQKEGSYEKTLLAIKNALKYISVPKINITVNKLNAEHLDDTVKFILEKFPNIKHFVFNNLDPIGRAIKNKWAIPRLVDSELSLHKALSYLLLKGKSFRVEMVPLCYMQGFEEFSTETRKIIKNEMYMYLFLNEKKRELKERNNFYYAKAPCCEVCFLNEICAGLNPRYVKLFGTDELFPVFENKNRIIRKVKNG